MKKLTLVVIAAVIATTLITACGNSTPKANLKTEIDTLSYTFGVTQSRGLRDYIVGRLNVDTTYIDQFIKGLLDGINAGDDAKTHAYMVGQQIGQQIASQIIPGINHEIWGEDSTMSISQKQFLAGLLPAVKNEEALFETQEAYEIFQQKLQSLKDAVLIEQYGENKAKGEQFLADNAKKDGVKVLPSGLQYKVLVEGTGAVPTESDVVVCNYEGKLINDSVFDSSYKRGKPFETKITRVIPGWTEALKMMPVGSTWEVYIPQELAYGSRKQGMIDPYSTLVFKVELLDIKEK